MAAVMRLDFPSESRRFRRSHGCCAWGPSGCSFHHQGEYRATLTFGFSARIAVLMRKPWVIAHRGASGHAPENTLAAFERAVQLGAGFIETDLHLTRDARFVAIHDATLERTTNGRGNV